MFLLQVFSLVLTFRKPIQEHFSRLKRVNNHCYFDNNTYESLQDLAFAESSETDKFVIHGQIINNVTVSHLLLGSFGKQEKIAVLVNTHSKDLVATGTFGIIPLTRTEAKTYLKNDMNEHNLLQSCPIDFKGFFCRELNYHSVIYLTALAKTNVSFHNGETFSVFLDYIIERIDRLKDFEDSKIISIFGVGYQDGDFTTNSLWNAVVDKLQKIKSEKVPKTFALNFVENRFEAVVGAQIEEGQFVWVPLRKTYWNTTIAEGLWTKSEGESVQLLGETEVLFNTGSNVLSIPQKYFTGFKKGLDRVIRKTPGCFIEEDKYSSNIFYICAAGNFTMETQLVFKTGAVMVLNFADFLIFYVEEYKCTVVTGEKDLNVTIIGLPVWKGFDFVLDGDRNRLGFKPNENRCEFCSVSEGQPKNSGN